MYIAFTMLKSNIFRYLNIIISKHIEFGPDGPMAFISGPRQVGKTHLVKSLFNDYHNWDTKEVKTAYLKDPYFFRSQQKWIVFDEIHKRKDFKKLLKSYYDSSGRSENFIVTGSGRFDHYKKGADSLQGRYFNYHLFPVSLDEFNGAAKKLSVPRDFQIWTPDTLGLSEDDLYDFGGFPAPLVRQSKVFLGLWKEQYLERLVKEDTRDFSLIIRIDQLELLARLLPERVGAPVSVRSLQEDLEVSAVAVKTWLRLFEILYFGFMISPYYRKVHRAVKKEKKWYFYQWPYVTNEGARFENYLAVQLKVAVTAWTEAGHGKWDLFYVRDQDRREVDFLITENLVPKALIEAKNQADELPSSARYYSEKFKIPAFVVTKKGSVRRFSKNQWSVPSHLFLKNLILS